jgi:hypothetical protein
MKRHEWELPVPPEYLQLQVRQVEVTPEVPEGRQFAIRRALLDSFPGSESSPRRLRTHRDRPSPRERLTLLASPSLYAGGESAGVVFMILTTRAMNALPRRFRPRTSRAGAQPAPFFQPRSNPRPE